MKSKFGIKEVVAIGIGTALFVALTEVQIPLGFIPNTALQPRAALLAFFAAVFGPIVGGIIGAALIFVIAGCPDLNGAVGGFATNGWSDTLNEAGRNAFGGTTVGMASAIIIETVLTFVFLMIIIGSTDKRAPAGLAPVSIGLGLTLIHLISIPVDNTSVNPARSLAMAIFNGGDSLVQVWVFILFPIVGAVLAGLLYKFVFECKCCCDGKCCDCKCEKKEEVKEEKAAE